MKRMAFLIATGIVASWVGFSAVHAEESRAAKIKRLQAEAKIAQLNAQAAAETVAAYEEAWRKTKKAAKEAVGRAKLLYNPTPVGVLQYLWDKPVQKFARATPPNYQSLPPLRAPELKDFRNLLPPVRPLSR